MPRMVFTLALGLGLLLTLPTRAAERSEIYLAKYPTLSPDGQIIAFAWRGDIWSAAIDGGQATRLTFHPASDTRPCFSPDGTRIAFVSRRTGSSQIFIMSAQGGEIEQVTWHTAGYTLLEWYPDGQSLLVQATRDHFGLSSRTEMSRLFRVSLTQRETDHLLFDAYASKGAVAPDGDALLFTRGGFYWYQKQFPSDAQSEIWLYDMSSEKYVKLLENMYGDDEPLWKPDGSGFYFVSGRGGRSNLWEANLDGLNGLKGEPRMLTNFQDDLIFYPTLSRDGKMIAFLHLFHLYRFAPDQDAAPAKIDLWTDIPNERPDRERKNVSRASDMDMTDDGLEIVLTAERDVWVMDTVLREPVPVTQTGGEESEAMFTPDGEAIYFIADTDGEVDIMRARRKDPTTYWWRNTEFLIDRVTTDTAAELDLSFSPDGETMAYRHLSGGLWLANLDGSNARLITKNWEHPDYDWSPDGKWLVYSAGDEDTNSDVWIVPTDGSRPPFNLSLHPDSDRDPVWSPDGKTIAYMTYSEMNSQPSIQYVHLTREEEAKSSRDRKMAEAIKKMEDKRKKKKSPQGGPKKTPVKTDTTPAPTQTPEATPTPTDTPSPTDATTSSPTPTENDKSSKATKRPDVKIDFENIHDRIHAIRLNDASYVSRLVWSPDSKKLAFSTSIKGASGIYTIEFPDQLTPKLLTAKRGSIREWIKEGDVIRWLLDGVPGTITGGGKTTDYPFSAKTVVDYEAWYRAGFIDAWRTMRDRFYDENVNNRDWDAVRAKYEDRAAQAPDMGVFSHIVHLMLGELSATHLGFSPRSNEWRPSDQWNEETAHLGLLFDPDYAGPGLKVTGVLPDTDPARVDTRIRENEIIHAIDGTSVTPTMDQTAILNGPLDRDIELTVADTTGTLRTVTVRPISYGAVTDRLRDKMIEDTRQNVTEKSEDQMGYLHIRGMDNPSLEDFYRDIYAQGVGRKGMIIDVRNNGGGYIAKYLLTVLCQPRHLLMKPRGAPVGDNWHVRTSPVWHKPIVVLCNERSGSNAEIFSHAVKYLRRGKLVGMRTHGAVIATGSTDIMGLGSLRVPGTGCFTIGDGEDMEKNGVIPDYIVEPLPGERPQGIDTQLDKAIEVLRQEIADWEVNATPPIRRASERPFTP